MSAPLYSSFVKISISQGGQYETFGQFHLAVFKKDGRFMIVALNNSKQVVLVINITQQIEWKIQNSVYGVYSDGMGKIYLIQFGSDIDCRVFTSIALTQKLSKGQIMCFDEGNGGKIVQNSAFSINYVTFDVNGSKINECIAKEENMKVYPTDDTLFRKLSTSNYGSFHVIQFAPGVYSFVEVCKNSSNTLFPFESSNSESLSDTPEKSKSKKKKSRKNRRESTVKKITPEEAGKQIQQAQLSKLKQSFSEKLEDLTKSIQKIHETPYLMYHLPSSDNDLISAIELIMIKNDAKREICKEKENTIETLRNSNRDTIQRDQLLSQLDSISHEVSLKRKEIEQIISENAELAMKQENIHLKIVEQGINTETESSIIYSVLEKEKNDTIAQLNSIKQEYNRIQNDSNHRFEEKKSVIQLLLSQEAELDEILSQDYSEEAEQIGEKVKARIIQTKKCFNEELVDLITESINNEKEYSKDVVLRALSRGISHTLDDLLDTSVDDNE